MKNPPLCYTRLLGQEKAKNLLGKTLERGRLPHGLLFKGPEGVGKCLYGRGLAAAINCRDTATIGACGVCTSCKKFLAGSHPDFTVVHPDKGAIKVDQVRQLIKDISYPAYESSVRVVVLEDVHTMRREAANALLKTLEEPPEGNLLILTADSSRQILPTLTSRCQVIPFMPLSLEDTVKVLIAEGVEEADARILGRLADGSPGVALTYFKEELVAVWKEVILFLSDPEIHPNRDVGRLLRLAEKMAAMKENLLSFLGLLRLWIRDLLLGEDEIVTLVGIEPEMKNWDSESLFARLAAIDQAERELARNCNKNLVCEVLLFTLQ